LAWLDGHQNLERMLADTRAAPPDLSRMRHLVDVLGHPERSAPAIHITGTNGKTSTARCLSSLLQAKGLQVGTFTSPHLELINERLAVDGTPITNAELVKVLTELASIEPMLDSGPGSRLSWFEILAAAAMVWFADVPVDVAVYEVGLGGRWDATNVIDAGVAVVTNVGLDHIEFLGPTRAHVAAEKAGIVKPGATLVLGETDPALMTIFAEEHPGTLWWNEMDYAVERNDLAVGGRLLDIRTPGAAYEEVWLDLHGRHQGDNFAAALVAAEGFFGAPLDDKMVREAAATVQSPGRLEVVGHEPLIVLDGAKNLEGAEHAAASIEEEFGAVSGVILVVGMLAGAGKDPEAMLKALGAQHARLLVTCAPPSPRAHPASVLAGAAARLGVQAIEADSVAEALEIAVGQAEPEELILVTGSLYVVGAARAVLAGR
jgi:dihydrofolate synthase/folylpolyglutamate synthase